MHCVRRRDAHSQSVLQPGLQENQNVNIEDYRVD